MRKIDFKKIKAQNFLCFGENGIEIDFKNYDSVVLIKGKNLDVNDNNLNSSNGSGKSSILDALLYGLFGKTVKNPKKIGVKDVINNKTNKKMVIEIYFDDIKIQRTRKPDGLKLWQSKDGNFEESTELTRGEIKQTQELIESILGFNCETFKSTCIFTDSNTDSYLESNASDRRIIIENLLGLEKYRTYNEIVKENIKQTKSAIAIAEIESHNADNSLNDIKKQLEQLNDKEKTWKKTINDEIEIIKNEIILLEKQAKDLAEFDPQVEKYNNAQKEIELKREEQNLLEEKILKSESTKDQIDLKMEEGKSILLENNSEFLKIKNQIDLISNEITQNQNTIEKTKNIKEGIVCKHCFSITQKENYEVVRDDCKSQIEELQKLKDIESNKITVINDKINEIKKQLQTLIDMKSKIVTSISANKSKIQTIQQDINTLQTIIKPETLNTISRIESKISLQKINIMEKTNAIEGNSPYYDLIITAKNNLETALSKSKDNKEKLVELMQKIPYFNFWADAFGDKGVRKFVIDQILPILNDHVAEMLDLLVDSNLILTFDNEFNETIKRVTDDTPIIYDLLSNGQKRRINLAISQAFAHVRELNTGSMPNIMFLDEVSINMDSQGNNSIYKLIKEMAKNKVVFVTTHDQELSDLLADSSRINLKMENGISSIDR
jgi:DNA repair exonuclease SbcCD ATPase subunit